MSEISGALEPGLINIIQKYLNDKAQEKLTGKSLQDFFNEYLDFIKSNRSYKYFLSSRLSLNHLMKFLDPNIRLNGITAREVDLFLTQVKENAPRGYLVYFRTLKSAFSKAQVWGYISKNPFKDIKAGRLQKNKITVINNNDLKIILSEINNKTIQLIVKTSIFSGCRLSEVINLRVRNLNVKDRTLIVGDADFTTKSRKGRIIPIPDKLFRELCPLTKNLGDDGFLFPKINGFPYSADYISKSFKKAIRKAGLSENLHFHSLRHSYASKLAASGASPYCLRDLLGHSSVSVTELYTHTNLADLRKTVNLLN